VVDEVLAVGDAEFQKKAVGKMQEVSREEGRTVLFVSHNMGAVLRLCHRSILLGNGEIQFTGDTNSCIKIYLSDFSANETRFNENNNEIQEKYSIELISISTSDSSGIIKNIFQYHERLNITLKVKKNIETTLNKILIAIHIINDKGNEVLLFTNKDDDFPIDFNTTINEIILEIPDNYLGNGIYYISLWIGDEYGEGLYKASNIYRFEIVNSTHSSHHKANGLIKLPSNWKQITYD
jgi:lipopolysaccharide transport system ATP-binding protein